MKISNLFIAVILSAILIFPVTNYSKDNNTPKNLVENSFKWFPQCLKSDYPGIVESTIYNIVILKKLNPEGNYSGLIKALNNIAEKDADPSIRYKAHLATIYLNFSEIINVKPEITTYDQDYIFDQIADQLKNKSLASN